MSRTPLSPCPRKSALPWCIFFALPAINDPLPAKLKFRENTEIKKALGALLLPGDCGDHTTST